MKYKTKMFYFNCISIYYRSLWCLLSTQKAVYGGCFYFEVCLSKSPSWNPYCSLRVAYYAPCW